MVVLALLRRLILLRQALITAKDMRVKTNQLLLILKATQFIAPALILGVLGNMVYDLYVKDVPFSDLLRVNRWYIFGGIAVLSVSYLIRERWSIWRSTGLRSYTKALSTSKYHPAILMPRIYSGVDFLGHGASKWTDSIKLFDQMLMRIRRQGRDRRARFLLLDPRKADSRQEECNKRLKSLLRMHALSETHPGVLEIRTYNQNPQFRLVFINSESLVIGHYKAYTADSSDSPQIEFDSTVDWSFHTPFREYFDELWANSRILTEEDWREFKTLADDRKLDVFPSEHSVPPRNIEG